jgi:hypothetical protein
MAQRFSSDADAWECPLCSSLQLLVFQADGSAGSALASSTVQSQAERAIKLWATEQSYDMKWSWKVEEGKLLFHSVDLQGSLSTFPRRFLNSFVGKERPLNGGRSEQQPQTWLLSTVSTK